MNIKYLSDFLVPVHLALLLGSLYLTGEGSTKALPHYDRVLLLEASSETSANVELGDVNADGHLDVILGKGRHWPLVNRVLLGNGKGGFSNTYDLGPASNRTYSGALVDLDGDKDLDVVVSNDRPDENLIYLNDGRGRFEVASKFGQTSWSTRYICTADMNEDGFPDIIVANRGSRRASPNYICINNGSGKFDTECISFSDYSSTTITPADFNQDGLMDLAVPHRDGGQSYLFVQTGKANFDFEQIPFGPADASIRMSKAADFDNDGDLDLVTIDIERGVVIYFQDANGTFTLEKRFGKPSSMPYALSVSDFNEDGEVDIVVGFRESESVIYFNQDSGKSFIPKKFGDGKGGVYGFAIGDLENR